jgi:phenylacetate-CoA ligase
VNRTLAKYLLLAIERARGERLDRFLRELERNQALPAREITRIQHEKLRALLTFVVQRNDYFREKYKAFDAFQEFSRLPVLTKQELRDNYRRLVTPGCEKQLSLVKTSGSTGEPLKFYRDRTVFGYTLASVYRAHRWHGLDLGAKEGMLWGIPASWKNRMKMHGRDLVLNRFREAEYNLDPRVLQRFYEDVRRRRPDYLFGYSSMVYEFALFVHEMKLPGAKLGLKAIVCTAEMIHDYQRTTMERAFGCPVISEYGAAETGIISYQCPQGRHHISDDCVLVEVVDQDGRPLPRGEVGQVTVTVLNSFSAPVIRYQLGDFGSLSSDTCGCGVNLSLIEKIIGRTSGVIVTPGGQCYHSIVVYYIMKDYADQFGGVRQFRVRQTAIDRLEFHIAADTGFSSESRQWLERRARAKFGDEMIIEFFVHDRLDRTDSGKLRDFETDLDVEQYLIASYHGSNSVAFGSPR